MQNQVNIIVVWLSFIVALVLTLIKFPMAIESFVPNYVPMVVLYWVIVAPSKVNIGIGWFIGFMVDFLVGSTIGLHAIAIGFMVWIIVTQFENIAFYSLLQQTIVVGVVNFIGQFLLFWTEHIFGVVTVDYNFFWSCVSTVVLWPILAFLLNFTYSSKKIY